MQIIRAILQGTRDAAALARFRDVRCKSSVETITKALMGNYRAEHLFALRQAVELYETYQDKIRDCDEEIERALHSLNEKRPAPAASVPKKRKRSRPKNEPAVDIHTALFTLVGGIDLTQIQGLGPYSALRIVAECGTNMTRWPTVKHFTSWLTLAPGNKLSGGKVLNSRTRRSSNRATTLFRLAAVSIGKTHTALGAFFRRLAARVGKAKAVTATARKLAFLFYKMLRYGAAYQDPGADYYKMRFRRRTLDNPRRRAKALGFTLVESAAVPDGVS